MPTSRNAERRQMGAPVNYRPPVSTAADHLLQLSRFRSGQAQAALSHPLGIITTLGVAPLCEVTSESSNKQFVGKSNSHDRSCFVFCVSLDRVDRYVHFF